MNRDIKVLITSISKKIPLLKAVRKALSSFGQNSRLFGADSDALCIGGYFVDQFWHMPKLNTLKQTDVLEYCKKNGINVIIPTRDGELVFWSEIQDFLFENGIYVMVSSSSSLKLCLDKQLFSEFLIAHDFKTPKTGSNISDLECKSFVVKERMGAGSIGIGLNLSKENALNQSKNLKNPIFQPFIAGIEYTVDLFVDTSHEVKGLIARQRLLVVDGESQITETVQNKTLESLCKKLALSLDLKGHVLFQVIQEEETDSYYVIECNPRFGGASTLAIRAGLDSFKWFFHEVLNENCPEFKRFPKELKLIRHAEDKIISL